MPRTRSSAGALLAGLFSLAALAQEEPPTRQQELEQLRNISDYQPLRLEDALPQPPGPGGQVSLATGDETGDDGLLLRPQLSVGLWERLELRAELPVGRLEGRSELGPFEATALGQLAPEGELRPAVSLRGRLTAPSDEAGLGAELSALASKSFGMQRLHLNAGYQVQRDAGDRYLLGVAGDHALSSRVLLVGEAFVERQRDQGDTAVGADVGTAWQLGQKVQLYGTVGVRRVGPDVDPWVLVGLQGG